jgi:hypothetical protein
VSRANFFRYSVATPSCRTTATTPSRSEAPRNTYYHQLVRDALSERGLTAHIRSLLVRWSKKDENHGALLMFCFALISWQQLGVTR